jgi:hypothetical protein
VTAQPPPGRAARPGSADATAGPPGAFLAVDRGTATTATALVGRVAGRRRLLAAIAAPAGADADALATLLVARGPPGGGGRRAGPPRPTCRA